MSGIKQFVQRWVCEVLRSYLGQAVLTINRTDDSMQCSQYIPTKASGYLRESADVAVWLINRTMVPTVPSVVVQPVTLVAM
jgi:hypothetical protein